MPPASRVPNEEASQVSFVTGNGGGCGPLKDAILALAPTDVAFLGQEHWKAGPQAEALRRWVADRGWSAQVCDGILKEKAVSCGTIAMARASIPTSCWPAADGPDLVPGRFTGVKANTWIKGGVR